MVSRQDPLGNNSYTNVTRAEARIAVQLEAAMMVRLRNRAMTMEHRIIPEAMAETERMKIMARGRGMPGKMAVPIIAPAPFPIIHDSLKSQH
ncbi:MAG: hypothetical protein ACOX42_06930 [Clostridia bacterium]